MKSNKGITLVALVVTIVVLLILAGVSISVVLGQNGLITQAQEAKKKTAEATKNEENEISSMSNYVYNETKSLPQTEETKPYYPSNEFKKVEGTDLSNGLVIEDASGNQYVWVEVPMTEEVYKTTKLNVTEFNEEVYGKIEEDLHKYVIRFRKNRKGEETNYIDEYSEESIENWFGSKNEYNNQKYKMLRGIYENGGFWISRYEAGTDKYRTSQKALFVTPKSQKDLYPYIYVDKAQAKHLAEQIKYDEHVGSIMLGVQWDLILAFLSDKANLTYNELCNNSVSIGNYYDATFTINRGKYETYGNLGSWYNYTEDLENIVEKQVRMTQTISDNGIMLTTGASEYSKKMNIYDIAGNVWEWTLENSFDEAQTGVFRGGSYNHVGIDTPVSFRSKRNSDFSGNTVGFRIVLY